jgi:ketosteroid isomerase-like protein
MTATNTALDVADRLFAAVARGDVDAVRALYAPDFEIWHNTDGATQDADSNLRTLAWMAENMRDMRYDDVRLVATETGFVQQHVLRATAANGEQLTLPACMVGVVKDGFITRLDEYFDSAHLGPLRL